MNFSFIPYVLNTSYEDLKENLLHDSSSSGVDFYSVKKLPISSIFGIPVNQIALYFHENKLVSVYTQLNESSLNNVRIIALLNKELDSEAKGWEVKIGMMYKWERGNEFLGLLCDNEENYLYLYYSLKKYNVFE